MRDNNNIEFSAPWEISNKCVEQLPIDCQWPCASILCTWQEYKECRQQAFFCFCWNHPSAHPRSMWYRTTTHSEEKQEHFLKKLNYNRIGRIIVQQICFIQQLYKSVLCGLCLCVWLYLCHPRSLNRNLTIVIHEGCEQSLCSEKPAFWQCIMAASIPSWAYQLQGGRSGWAFLCKEYYTWMWQAHNTMYLCLSVLLCIHAFIYIMYIYILVPPSTTYVTPGVDRRNLDKTIHQGAILFFSKKPTGWDSLNHPALHQTS